MNLYWNGKTDNQIKNPILIIANPKAPNWIEIQIEQFISSVRQQAWGSARSKRKCKTIWESCEKVWESMRKYEKVWESILNTDNVSKFVMIILWLLFLMLFLGGEGEG